MSDDPRILIDDPDLGREFKVQLVRAWAAARMDDQASWQPYLDEYASGEHDRAPFADQRFIKLLEDGTDAQKANASRFELGERLRQDCLNVPDDMLDLGARGLEFFELFLPAATNLGYESNELTDYYARFDAERGMRLHSLGRDVDTLDRGLGAGRTELAEHQECLTALRSGWSGSAAAAAAETVQRRNAEAEADLGRLAGLVEVLTEANLTLSAAVTTKAYKVVSLHQPTVGGCSADQIDVLAGICVAVRDSDYSLADNLVTGASYWFPGLAGDEFRHFDGIDGGGSSLCLLDRDDVVHRAARIVEDWFDGNFRHVYEEKQQEFAAACAECAEAVHAAYDSAIAEARTVEAQRGIRPAAAADQGASTDCDAVPNAGAAATSPPHLVAPSDPGCANTGTAQVGQPGSGGGSAAAPTAPAASASAAPGPVASPGPSVAPAPGGIPGWGGAPGLGVFPGIGTAPASGESDVGQGLAAGLGELGSIIRPLIDDVVSGLVGKHDEDHRDEFGDSRAEEVDDRTAGTTHEKTLELILGGKSWTLSIDEDDQGIHLEMTDAQGGTSRFAVEVGPDGLPRIVAENGVGEDPSESAPGVAVDSQNHRPGGGEGDGPIAETALESSPVVCEPQPEEAPQPPIVTLHESAPDQASEPAPLLESLPAPGSENGPDAGDSGAQLAEAGPL
ncbi:hypothetical protein BFN03_03680 [Rhodococcus sp. WMMA185]|uniref:hypothetical protein n=1 Tax=Rhodococcus sp. WMMA185 TaxID=679318 RepID=UPI000878BCC0|nr:hypothetical protein [Rhodococcus sp. WMMA185]AOW92109.1 hypothetical protein BFN03_03680 [Rhodococcus sp. WMMA185]